MNVLGIHNIGVMLHISCTKLSDFEKKKTKQHSIIKTSVAVTTFQLILPPADNSNML
jgi:hypothetical protein